MENNNKPVVNLISRPDNMLKVVYTACRTCYSADYPINIYESTDDEEKMLKLIEKVISSGHNWTYPSKFCDFKCFKSLYPPTC